MIKFPSRGTNSNIPTAFWERVAHKHIKAIAQVSSPDAGNGVVKEKTDVNASLPSRFWGCIGKGIHHVLNASILPLVMFVV